MMNFLFYIIAYALSEIGSQSIIISKLKWVILSDSFWSYYCSICEKFNKCIQSLWSIRLKCVKVNTQISTIFLWTYITVAEASIHWSLSHIAFYSSGIFVYYFSSLPLIVAKTEKVWIDHSTVQMAWHNTCFDVHLVCCFHKWYRKMLPLAMLKLSVNVINVYLSKWKQAPNTKHQKSIVPFACIWLPNSKQQSSLNCSDLCARK